MVKEENYMSFTELVLIGIGLSMDAFATAICKGLCMPKLRRSHMFIIALFFGGFQALMPFLGWLLGTRFSNYITAFDHWIAFILLGFIGGKMLVEALRDGDEAISCDAVYRLDIKQLAILAVATSIDALAAGITFAFLKVNIAASVLTIGVITFAISAFGVVIGHKFGARFKKRAEICGGVILILIGLKILLEHLGIISF